MLRRKPERCKVTATAIKPQVYAITFKAENERVGLVPRALRPSIVTA